MLKMVERSCEARKRSRGRSRGVRTSRIFLAMIMRAVQRVRRMMVAV